MKNQGIPQILYLILVLGCTSVQAETKPESEKGSVSTVHFGRVDAIYAKESRMVIDDFSFRYTAETKFYYASGNTSASSKNLRPGILVKFHAVRKPPYTILKDLKIISSDEYKEAQKALRKHDDD